MERITLLVLLLSIISPIALAQERSSPATAREKRDATDLAARFFNRYQQTHQIRPLIGEYFVSDFTRRLEFCRKTEECVGHNRDFWKPDEFFSKHLTEASRNDVLREYADLIDGM